MAPNFGSFLSFALADFMLWLPDEYFKPKIEPIRVMCVNVYPQFRGFEELGFDRKALGSKAQPLETYNFMGLHLVQTI